MNMDKLELAPKEEWVASYNGFPIYINPRLAPGWIEFRNAKGEIMGMISDVGGIYIAPNRAP
jgi:hypothetical protein